MGLEHQSACSDTAEAGFEVAVQDFLSAGIHWLLFPQYR